MADGRFALSTGKVPDDWQQAHLAHYAGRADAFLVRTCQSAVDALATRAFAIISRVLQPEQRALALDCARA